MKWNDIRCERKCRSQDNSKLSGYATGRMKLPLNGMGRFEEEEAEVCVYVCGGKSRLQMMKLSFG